MIFLSAYLDLTHVLCQLSPQKSPVDLQVLWAHSGWTMPPEICSDLDHFLRQLYTHIHWNIYIYVYIYVCIHTIMYIYIYVCVKYPWKWPVHIFKSTAGKPYVSTLYQFQSWCFKSYYNICIYIWMYFHTRVVCGGVYGSTPIWLNSGALEVLGFPSEVSGPRRDFGPDLSQMEPRPWAQDTHGFPWLFVCLL